MYSLCSILSKATNTQLFKYDEHIFYSITFISKVLVNQYKEKVETKWFIYVLIT